MSGVIIMKKKDLEKIKVMELSKKKLLTQAGAARRLNLTDRQIRNIFKRYQQSGDEWVISKQLGRPSRIRS